MGYINNSRKWDKCAVLLNTAHTSSASFSSLASPQPTSSSLSSVLSCLRVVMLSVRTHSGCSVSMLIDRKIACNQGKKFCNSNYVSSLVDTRSDRHVRSRNVSRHSSFLVDKKKPHQATRFLS